MTRICDLLAKGGEEVRMMTKFPTLFRDVACETVKYTRYFPERAGFRKRSYATRRHIPETTQWQDLLINYQLSPDETFFFPWKASPNRFGLESYAVVSAPHDMFGFKPCRTNWEAMDADLAAYRASGYQVVMLGKDDPIHKLKNIDVNLVGSTEPEDVADLVAGAAHCFGQIGWMLPFAEGLRRPATIYFSKGMKEMGDLERTITPEKLICNHNLTRGLWI
jgi:hypothetical protein